MARIIKDTPVIGGDDARRFQRIIEENENKKVPIADYERAVEFFNKIEFPPSLLCPCNKKERAENSEEFWNDECWKH